MSGERGSFEIDLVAVAANVRAVRALVGRDVWLCAALKADAYGFGLVPVARAVKRAGADAIGAGSIVDGIRLRDAGIRGPVLVYGGDVLTEKAIHVAEGNRLTVTVHDARSLKACTRQARAKLDVMLEVDSGAGRLGFDPQSAIDAIDALKRTPALRLRGLYTHMSVPARAAHAALREQMRRFAQVADGYPSLLTMAASSRVLDLAPDMRLNAVDVGRAVYGLLPRRGGRLGHRLRPALARLASTLVAVKTPPGSAARIGVIPFGRAGGMASLSAGHVLLSGRRARVIGEPSLEHTRIDLTRHPRARVGDEVVIVGRQRGAEITVEDVLRAHPELPPTGVGLAVGPSVLRVYRR